LKIFETMVDRPVGLSLLAFAFIVLGVAAYMRLGASALPSRELPSVAVFAQMPGANAQVMASVIAAPLERHLGRIPGLADMQSISAEGQTTLQLRFEVALSSDRAAREVQAAIHAAAVDLPADLPAPPWYRKIDTASIPVLWLSLTSATLRPDQLRDLADNELAPALSQLAGVGRVETVGSSPRAVRVEMDPTAMTAAGLSASDVSAALRAASVNAPLGTLSDGGKHVTVLANDALSTPDDFARLVVSVRGDHVVRVGDIARVFHGKRDESRAAWFDDRPSVGVRVSRQPGANAMAISAAVRAWLPVLRQRLPKDVSVTPIIDLTQTTRSALGEVGIALLLSVAMVMLIMMAFLRRAGPTLIASVSIPLALAGACLVMWALGYTLNTLSLLALVLCIGFVVDDAIVVIENIVRHVENGVSPREAALTGTREIALTVVSITVSLLALLAPLWFGDGVVIMLAREFSVTLSATIAISAVVSLTLTPALCSRYLRPRAAPLADGRLARVLIDLDRRIQRSYEGALDWALTHRRPLRWLPLAMTAIATLGAWAVSVTAGSGFMPREDTGMLRATVVADAAVSPTQMSQYMRQVGRIMRADTAVEHVATILGDDEAGAGGAVGNKGVMFVDLKPRGARPGQRKEPIEAVVQRINEVYSRLGGVEVRLRPIQFIEAATTASRDGLYGFSLLSVEGVDVQPWMQRVVSRLRASEEVVDVASDVDNAGKLQQVIIDRDRADALNVSIGAIDAALYDIFGQRQLARIYSGINQFWVVLSAHSAKFPTARNLLDVRVRNAAGELVPLAALARVAEGTTAHAVTHRNQFEAADIGFNLAPGVTAERGHVVVDRVLRDVGLPSGIRKADKDESQRIGQLKFSGTGLLVAAAIAMYLVLGILYEHFGHPLTILATLPTASAGAMLAMLATRTPLTLITLLAVLVLMGIVKKSAILMVDFALTAERQRGLSPVEAIREAALVRYRPIAMTTLVAVMAALPLAVGFGSGAETRQPLGIAIVGGLVFAQVLSMLATPAVYLWNHDRKLRLAAA
jgi:multidrug efflux pump